MRSVTRYPITVLKVSEGRGRRPVRQTRPASSRRRAGEAEEVPSQKTSSAAAWRALHGGLSHVDGGNAYRSGATEHLDDETEDRDEWSSERGGANDALAGDS